MLDDQLLQVSGDSPEVMWKVVVSMNVHICCDCAASTFCSTIFSFTDRTSSYQWNHTGHWPKPSR